MKQFCVLNGLLAVLVLLGACAQPGPAAAVTSVSIDQTDMALPVGESLALSATVTATGGADESVTWSSSHGDVATVSAAGLVQAVAAGTATITAASVLDATRSDSIEITVTSPSAIVSVVIDQADMAIVVGESLALSATVTATGGADESLAWSSSDGAIATVSAAGLVQAVAAGSATITAASEFDPTKSASIQVTVTTDPEVVSVVIDQGDTALVVAETLALSVTVIASGGANEDVAWSSGDDAVATVSAAGVVEALGPGTVMITASSVLDSSRSDSIQVTVTPAPAVLSVVIDQDASEVVVGKTVTLTATVTATGGADESVTWSSGDDAVATVSAAGVVEAIAPGTVTITASSVFDASRSDSIDVAVMPVNWAKLLGTTSADSANAVAVDAAGSIVIAGDTYGDLSGDSSGNSDAFVIKYSSAGTELWARQFGTAAYDNAYAVAVDPRDGSVLVAGNTGTGGLLGDSMYGGADALLRKYDSEGGVLWTRQFGTAEHEFAHGIAVDAKDGSVLVVGYTGGAFEDNSAYGGWDVFIRKFDSDGETLWTMQFGTAEDDYAYAVALDAVGGFLIAGETYGVLDSDAGSAGARDAFVRKYDSEAEVQWTRQFGTTGNDHARAVALGAGGSFLVAGSVAGSLEGVSSGGGDGLLRKYDGAGTALWTRQFGTTGDDYAFGVATDADDNVLVVGFQGVASGMTSEGFVRTYNSDGMEPSSNHIVVIADGDVRALALDADGNVVVTGNTTGFQAGISIGGTDGFVRKYAP